MPDSSNAQREVEAAELETAASARPAPVAAASPAHGHQEHGL